jgi:hypothetical protein
MATLGSAKKQVDTLTRKQASHRQNFIYYSDGYMIFNSTRSGKEVRLPIKDDDNEPDPGPKRN